MNDERKTMSAVRVSLAAWALTLVFVSGAVMVTYHYHGSPKIGVDDANIFLVYARNLAGGHGFVYNVGGERVEGFTSLLWTLICTVFFRFSRRPELGILLFSAALMVAVNGLIAAGVARRSVRQGRPGRIALAWAGVYLVLVLASPSYVTWMSITLMDAGLFGALVALGTVMVMAPDGPNPSGLLFALALLIPFLIACRPEAAAICPLLILLFGLRVGAARGKLPALRSTGVLLAVFLVSICSLTIFRLRYFGYPLPNTYYAKMSTSLTYNLSRGVRYLAGYLWRDLVALIAAISALAFILRSAFSVQRSAFSPRRSTLDGEVAASVSLLLLLLPVLAGGDHFRMYRFFQPAYPLLCLTLVLSLMKSRWPGWLFRKLYAGSKPRRRAVLLLAAPALVVFTLFSEGGGSWWKLRRQHPLASEFLIAEQGRQIGATFASTFSNLPQLKSLGVVAAGAVKFSYPGEVIDLMGLNNLRMGHSPGGRIGLKNHAAFDTAIFFELNPDIFMPQVASWSPGQGVPIDRFENGVLKGIFASPTFTERYQAACLRRRDATDTLAVRGLFRNDVLSELRATGLYDVANVDLVLDTLLKR
jgi:hypothetical protein